MVIHNSVSLYMFTLYLVTALSMLDNKCIGFLFICGLWSLKTFVFLNVL